MPESTVPTKPETMLPVEGVEEPVVWLVPAEEPVVLVVLPAKLPNWLEAPLNSIHGALLEWEEKGCNAAADKDDILAVTKRSVSPYPIAAAAQR